MRGDTLYTFHREEATLAKIASHWVTFRVHIASVYGAGTQVHRESADFSEPMEKLLLSWDDGKGRLKVEVISGSHFSRDSSHDPA